MNPLGDALRWVEVDWDLAAKVGISLVVVLAFFLVRALVLLVLWRRVDKPRARFLVRRAVSYSLFFLLFLTLLFIWFEGLSGLPTYLGLLSAGLAIALKDPIANLMGWVYILSTRPFSVGDRVQIGQDIGDIIDIQAFRTVMLEVGRWVDADQGSGRILYVPNARVFTDTVANYHVGFPYLWHEIPVLLTFESDWKTAKRLFLQIVEELEGDTATEAERSFQEASKQFFINNRDYRPTVYTAVRESGILLTLRYLCDVRRRRQSEMAVWERILETVASTPGLSFAYPTRRLTNAGAALCQPEQPPPEGA